MVFYSQFKEGKAEAEKEVTQHGSNLGIADSYLGPPDLLSLCPFAKMYLILQPGRPVCVG